MSRRRMRRTLRLFLFFLVHRYMYQPISVLLVQTIIYSTRERRCGLVLIVCLLQQRDTKGSSRPLAASATATYSEFQPHGGNQESRWFSLLLTKAIHDYSEFYCQESSLRLIYNIFGCPSIPLKLLMALQIKLKLR